MHWELEGEENVLAKKHGLSLISQRFINPKTAISDEYTFCTKEPGVTVVPILSDGNLVITRQFKQGSGKVFWEFPAGQLPKGGLSDDQAVAELKEESGLTAGKMVELGIASAGGPRKNKTHEYLFVALNCSISEPKPDPDEILEVFKISPGELWELIRTADGSLSAYSEMAFMRAVDRGFVR